LTFTDRVVITLVHLRLAIPHAALAVAYQVDRATVTRAVTQIRPLLSRRGFATPAGTRLHTLADVFAYAAAERITLRVDATEIRVRRPRQGRPDRKAFVSGKLKQYTIKTTVAADRHGATLWCGTTRPGRMHNLTAIRVEGAGALLDAYPDVNLLVDAGLSRTGPRPPRAGLRAAAETSTRNAGRKQPARGSRWQRDTGGLALPSFHSRMFWPFSAARVLPSGVKARAPARSWPTLNDGSSCRPDRVSHRPTEVPPASAITFPSGLNATPRGLGVFRSCMLVPLAHETIMTWFSVP
jgi:hypothetical protein